MGLNIFQITKAQRYKLLLWFSSFIFVTVSATSVIAIYQSYSQCKAMEWQEEHQREYCLQIQDKFKMQQEYFKELIENPDFWEHTLRKQMQIVGESEILFRFE